MARSRATIELNKQQFSLEPDEHSASLDCAATLDEAGDAYMGMDTEPRMGAADLASGRAGSALGRISERASAMLAGFATPSASGRGVRTVTGLQAAGVKSTAVDDYFSVDAMDLEQAGTNLTAILEEEHLGGGADKKKVKTYRIVEFDVARDDLCGAVINAKGGIQLCTLLRDVCPHSYHKKNGPGNYSPGWRIAATRDRCFAVPSVSQSAADGSDSFRLHRDEAYPMDRWTPIFAAMNAKDAKVTAHVDGPDGMDNLLAAHDEAEAMVAQLSQRTGPTPLKSITRLVSKAGLKFDDAELRAYAKDQEDRWADVIGTLSSMSADAATLDARLGAAPEGHATVWGTVETLCSSVQSYRSVVEKLLEKDDLTQETRLDLVLKDQQKLVDFERRLAVGEEQVTKALAAAADDQDLAHRTKSQLDLVTGNGGLGSTASQNRRIAHLEGTAEKLRSDFAASLELIIEVNTALDDLQSKISPNSAHPGGASGVDGLALVELRKQAEDNRVAVDRLTQTMAGGGISTSVGRFDSYSDTLTFVKEHFPADKVYQCFVDIMIAFGWVEDSVTYQEELQLQEVHSAKTGRTPEQSVVIQSFRTHEPPILAGPKGVRDAKHHFGALTTFSAWDGGTDVDGTKNRINMSLQLRKDSWSRMIDQYLEGYPVAASLCRELAAWTMDFWRDLCMSMHEWYRRLLVRGYGDEHTSDREAQASSWRIVTTLLRVLFRALRKVRVFAENGYTQTGSENAIYLHGVLMAHRVMQEFKKAKFFEHPEFYPKLLMHLFETCAPKSAMDALRVSNAALTSDNRALSRRVETLENGLATLKRRFDRLEGIVSNGGGGDDGGDSPAGGRKKKKKKNNRNGGPGGQNGQGDGDGASPDEA